MVVQKELFGESKHIEFKEEIPKRHEKFFGNSPQVSFADPAHLGKVLPSSFIYGFVTLCA